MNNSGTGTGWHSMAAPRARRTTLAAGTYSIQNGSLSIGSTATVTVASDTISTYIYEPNGTFTNAGKVTFGRRQDLFLRRLGGFTSTGTTAGALTFTGGNDSAATQAPTISTMAGPTGAQYRSNAKAAFGPATYYIINGDLAFNGGATLTCPGCAVSTSGGAGGLATPLC